MRLACSWIFVTMGILEPVTCVYQGFLSASSENPHPWPGLQRWKWASGDQTFQSLHCLSFKTVDRCQADIGVKDLFSLLTEGWSFLLIGYWESVAFTPLSPGLKCSQTSGAGCSHPAILVSLSWASILCQRQGLWFCTRCLTSTTKTSSISLSYQKTLLWVPHGKPSVPAGCFVESPTERTPGTQDHSDISTTLGHLQ